MTNTWCYRDRIVIPAVLRGYVLAAIHAAHQGVSGMAGRIDEPVFWAGIHPEDKGQLHDMHQGSTITACGLPSSCS